MSGIALALFDSAQLEGELLANLNANWHLHRHILPVDADSHRLPTGYSGLHSHHLRLHHDRLRHDGRRWGDGLGDWYNRHSDGLRHRLWDVDYNLLGANDLSWWRRNRLSEIYDATGGLYQDEGGVGLRQNALRARTLTHTGGRG